jgi:hypothetical protein
MVPSRDETGKLSEEQDLEVLKGVSLKYPSGLNATLSDLARSRQTSK